MCFQKIYQSLKVDLEILEQQWNSEHGRTSIQEHPHDLSYSLPAHISNRNKGFCPLKKGDPVSKRKGSSELPRGIKLSSDREISMGLP